MAEVVPLAVRDAAVRERWVRQALEALSLEQKVGQMLVAGFAGTTLSAEARAMVERCHLGGVMLGESNVATAEQLEALVGELQRLALTDIGLPMIVSVDQEGGAVNRLRGVATTMPTAMAIGATRSVDYAYACARAMALEMRALGINLDYAPVLDVNSEPANPVIGIRSFGESPTLVAEMGVATIRGLRDGGIVATAKHFPGHGGTTVDSHLDLPLIQRRWEQLRCVDLPPFEAAIAAGVEVVMSAHAVYPALGDPSLRSGQAPSPVAGEANLPATMSRQILSDLLRGRLGFEGLVISDALVMQAIADRYTLGEAAVAAIQAGVDLALILATVEEQVRVYEELLRAVRAGRVAEDRVDASVARILGLKARVWGPGVRGQGPGGCGVDCARWPVVEHEKLARAVARDSVTLLRNDEGLLPLRMLPWQRLGLIAFASTRFSPVEETVCDNGPLYRLLRERHGDVRHLCLGVDPQDGGEAVDRFVEECDTVLVATRNARLMSGQAAIVRRALAAGKPTVVLAVRSPYDVMSFPSVGTYVVSYGDAAVSLEAAVALLCGDYEPRGKLPVTIPGLFECGHGLERF